MIWLYRLQQRLSITRNESIAIITLLGMLMVGLAVQHWRPSHATDRSEAQARVEARFQQYVAGLPAPNRPGSTVAASDAENHSAAGPRINLNTASRTELQRLPGIGPALSERIDVYRAAHGPFQRVDDIVRVRGIGDKTLADIRALVAVKRP